MGDRRTLRQLPAIDGLRAVAVFAVVGYHADLRWLRGGFLGVDVFFVLSGFLITGLLLEEQGSTGTVALRSFWARRFRRLVPALLALLTACLLFWYVAYRDELFRFRGQFGAAVGYFSNWHLIANGDSYFAQLGRPSPLLHLWSLAVEEQFYVVWPVLVLALVKTRLGRSGNRRGLAFVFFAVGIASSIAMGLLVVPDSDPSRVYFGTDTHLGGLAVGAALAALRSRALASSGEAGFTWSNPSRLPRVLGVVSLAITVSAFALVTDDALALYRGGFFLFACVAATLVWSVTSGEQTVVSRLLSLPVVRFFGTRAYGIYLWHWPVVVLTRPRLDLEAANWQILTIRLALPLVLAEVSFRLIEEPARTQALRKFFRSRIVRSAPTMLTAGVVACASALLVSLPRIVAANPNGSIEATLRAGQSFLTSSSVGSATEPTTSIRSATVSPTTASSSSVASAEPTTTIGSATAPPATAEGLVAATESVTRESLTGSTTSSTTIAAPTLVPLDRSFRVVAIGDSVMVGASPQLVQALGSRALVDALVGRQLVQATPILRKLVQETAPEVVLINLGNNGPVTQGQVVSLLRTVRAVPLVIVSTVAVGRAWEKAVNSAILQAFPAFPNVVVFDWQSLTVQQPGLLFRDRTHLVPSGARRFASGVSQLIDDYCDEPPVTTTTPPPPLGGRFPTESVVAPTTVAASIPEPRCWRPTATLPPTTTTSPTTSSPRSTTSSTVARPR